MEFYRSKNVVDDDNLYTACPSCEGKFGQWQDCPSCDGTGVMTREDHDRWVLIYVVAESLATVETDKKFTSRVADDYEHIFSLNHAIIADYILKLPEEVKVKLLENIL